MLHIQIDRRLACSALSSLQCQVCMYYTVGMRHKGYDACECNHTCRATMKRGEVKIGRRKEKYL